LQKIIKKNVKNNISFSINNYNNNTTNNNLNDFEELCKNINQRKINDGIRGLNKSLDISRNKSPSIPLKPRYIIKSQNPSFQNTNNSIGVGITQNKKSQDLGNGDILSLNNLYYKRKKLNNLMDKTSNFIPTDNIIVRNISSKFNSLFNKIIICRI